MRKQMLDKVKEAEAFLNAADSTHKEAFLEYLGRWIAWFQHERLIHLLVTLFFALFSMLFIFAFMATANMSILVLVLIFAITTGFYIRHYYLLENKTQYLYELYDRIRDMQ